MNVSYKYDEAAYVNFQKDNVMIFGYSSKFEYYQQHCYESFSERFAG